MIYAIRGSGTTGAAATKDYLSITALANTRVKVVGITLGNQSATAAQGVNFQIVTATVDATGNAFTPVPVDQDTNRAARSTAKDTISVNASGTIKVLDEFAFDIVASYTKWYPPGKELIFGNTQILVVRKTVGADTSTWSITVFIDE